MSETAFIILFILCFILGIVLLLLGLGEDNMILTVIGVLFIVMSIILVSIADSKEKESIKENCEKINGEIVKYKDRRWDVATKTYQTSTELYCLKDGQLTQ